MIGMRNRLIHAYFELDHDVVWNTVKDVLPSFSTTLQKTVNDYHHL